MEWLRLDFVLPIAGALAAGCLIGFEREFRARAAGFRTHALVALASALLMLAAQHQVEWAGSTTPSEVLRIDPVRMAHGVLTGIGFLCGGVIFREGLSVHGLTTAASLWTTSALGMLFGVGLYGLALAGTVLALMVLSVFRLFDKVMPSQSVVDLTVRFRRQGAPDEAELQATLSEMKLKVKRLAHRLTDQGTVVEYAATVASSGKHKGQDLAGRLQGDPRVLEYAIEPRNA